MEQGQLSSSLEEDFQEFAVKQHRELRDLLQEDEVRMREGKLSRAEIGGVMKLAEEVKTLEAKMHGEALVSLKKAELQAQVEVLQTRTVPLEEVKQDLQSWIGPFRQEVNMLTAGPVTRLSREEYLQMKKDGACLEELPMASRTAQR